MVFVEFPASEELVPDELLFVFDEFASEVSLIDVSFIAVFLSTLEFISELFVKFALEFVLDEFVYV